MATILTRAANGDALTHNELDTNFTNLNSDKVETSIFPNVSTAVTATTGELNTMAGITATTAELNLMDGVTATTAELNVLDASAQAVTKFIRTVEDYTWDEAGQDSIQTYDVASNLTETTWTSIGPTGSGATKIWTALDDLPSDAKVIKLAFYASFTDVTEEDDINLRIVARPTGSTVTNYSRQGLLFDITGQTSDTNAEFANVTISGIEREIPLDANLTFEVQWDGNPDPLDAAVIILRGFKR